LLRFDESIEEMMVAEAMTNSTHSVLWNRLPKMFIFEMLSGH
jgi:hypothetical protein